MRPSCPLPLLGLAALLSTGCLATNQPPVVTDPCEPNPCTQGDKTTCVNDNGRASCLCKEGTLPRPNGSCEPLSAANCPEHPGDGAEPDDCLARARPLSTSTTVTARGIEPVGDYDFFRIDGSARNVYTLSAEPGPGSLLPRLDVFDAQGTWLTALDGSPRVSLGFKARATTSYYVRVSHSPRDPSPATGAYTLSLGAPVVDDHGDTPAEATSLTPSPAGGSLATLSGRFEYGQDDDFFAFPVTARLRYRIEFDTSGGRVIPALAAFIREDVKTPFQTAQSGFLEFEALSTTTVYVDLYSARGESAGYAFRVLEFR